MPLRRVTVEIPSDLLVRQGVVPAVFFEHNTSVEILRVYAFQPRERVLLVRVVRTGPPRTQEEILRSRERLRRRYHLQDFEILQVEDSGRAYVALLRQRNPTILEAVLEDLGAGVTPTTPILIQRDTATLSFLADDAATKRVFALLKGLGMPWRLRGRKAIRHGVIAADDALTPRQREILSLAWNLGYFDIPARAGLEKLAELIGLSRNTVSQHLRRGLRRILRESLH
jgi:predicted DNA binding protein